MRRTVYALMLAGCLAALAAPAPAPAAGFRVPAERRVENVSPGYCAWAAIETVAKSRGPLYPDDDNYKKLLTLVALRQKSVGEPCIEIHPDGRRVETRFDPGAAYPSVVNKQLAELKVTFRENLPVRQGGTKDFAFIKKACDDRLGVMVDVRDCPPVCDSGGHALAVTDVSDDEEEFTDKAGKTVTDTAVYYYDSNNTKGLFRVSKTWLMAAWSGWAVVVVPQGERKNPPAGPERVSPFHQYPYVNKPAADTK